MLLSRPLHGVLAKTRYALVRNFSSGNGGRKSKGLKTNTIVEKVDSIPTKGTRDFYPDDMVLRTWLFDKWRKVSLSYGFHEYDAPVVESERLYTRKAGEDITEQLYSFSDKGDRRLSLRPEMTPSLARLVMNRKPTPLHPASTSLTPLKWYAIPQCWRYERMTRGRRREHYQWNMDIWGVPSIEAEAELLSAIVTFCRYVGLTSSDVCIKVNSRQLLAEMLIALDIPSDCLIPLCVCVDKMNKISCEELIVELVTVMSAHSIDNSDGADAHSIKAKELVDMLKMAKTNDLKQLNAMLLTKMYEQKCESDEQPDHEVLPSVQELTQLQDLCGDSGYGIADWVVVDPTIVRGLSYYTGVVFECMDRKGEFRSICGGGRYDKLLSHMSGGESSTPAVGFGFGDAVIMEILQSRGLVPSVAQVAPGPDYFVYATDAKLSSTAGKVASLLRQGCVVCTPAGEKGEKAPSVVGGDVRVELVLTSDRKLKAVLQRANKIAAKVVILCRYGGVDEDASQGNPSDSNKSTELTKADDDTASPIVLVIKNMVTGEQISCGMDDESISWREVAAASLLSSAADVER